MSAGDARTLSPGAHTLDVWHKEHNTRTIRYWGPIILRQAIANQRRFRRQKGFLSAARLFDFIDRSKIAFVAAAGPSLTAALPILQGPARDRLVVFCVDSAFPILAKAGVTPDLVVNLDAEGHLLERAFAVRAAGPLEFQRRKTVLLCPTFAHPRLIDAWQTHVHRPILLFNLADPANPAYTRVGRFYPNFPSFLSKPNVGHFSVDVAYQSGFDEIAWAGLDLAYPSGRVYAEGTEHDGGSLPEDASFVQLDNLMRPCATTRTFFFDARAFLRHWKDGYSRVTTWNLATGIVPLLNQLDAFRQRLGLDEAVDATAS